MRCILSCFPSYTLYAQFASSTGSVIMRAMRCHAESNIPSYGVSGKVGTSSEVPRGVLLLLLLFCSPFRLHVAWKERGALRIDSIVCMPVQCNPMRQIARC